MSSLNKVDWAARWQCYNASLFPQISSFLLATTIVLGSTPDTNQPNIHWWFFSQNAKFGRNREYNYDGWRRELIPFSWSRTTMRQLLLFVSSLFSIPDQRQLQLEALCSCFKLDKIVLPRSSTFIFIPELLGQPISQI